MLCGMAFWLSCFTSHLCFCSTIRAFRDCSSLGLLTAPLGQRPANRRRQSLPASRNKRSVVRAPCTCLHVTASCLFTPLCCSCLHTVAYVLVAWCKTSHEPIVFWVDNEPARIALSKGTADSSPLRAIARVMQSVEVSHPVIMWYERVCSHSNPAAIPRLASCVPSRPAAMSTWGQLPS